MLASQSPFGRSLASRAFLSVAPVVVVSLIGQAVTMPKISTWYATLVKPAFNPPNWVFGPVWTALFVMMAYAVWRVLSCPVHQPGRKAALVVFYLQLVLNGLWSVAFFGLESPALALVVILALLGSILETIRRFLPVNRFAAFLLIPYAVWVSYACILNTAIFVLNR